MSLLQLYPFPRNMICGRGEGGISKLLNVKTHQVTPYFKVLDRKIKPGKISNNCKIGLSFYEKCNCLGCLPPECEY